VFPKLRRPIWVIARKARKARQARKARKARKARNVTYET
jgi:hypothetical protein